MFGGGLRVFIVHYNSQNNILLAALNGTAPFDCKAKYLLQRLR
ncbi:hypothetical protein AAULR_05778 [Lacticaseibacillus rhamnosus MTCC 5462]|nr:hypothetical protein AAULR_05778 [Lacticaseibacillus rhamnosus MTCC 5462]